jgi:hypothetical protein
MVVVASAALGSAAWLLVERSRRYSEEALFHRLICDSPCWTIGLAIEKGYRVPLTEHELSRHRRAAELFERAARYPWLGAPRIPPQSDAKQ